MAALAEPVDDIPLAEAEDAVAPTVGGLIDETGQPFEVPPLADGEEDGITSFVPPDDRYSEPPAA